MQGEANLLEARLDLVSTYVAAYEVSKLSVGVEDGGDDRKDFLLKGAVGGGVLPLEAVLFDGLQHDLRARLT